MRYAEAIANLRAAAEMIQAVPPDQFNMNHWWLADGMAFDDYRNRMYRVADGPCGCAIGHMIQKGLLGSPDVLGFTIGAHGGVGAEWTRDGVFGRVSDALKLYNSSLAQFLFDQYFYPRSSDISREQVVRRIEFVISELEAMK